MDVDFEEEEQQQYEKNTHGCELFLRINLDSHM